MKLFLELGEKAASRFTRLAAQNFLIIHCPLDG
jgi:hypothetical protein